MDVITADSLQELIREALVTPVSAGPPAVYPTAAALNVFTPRTWRTPAAQMPVLLLQSPSERKENVAGRTGPGEYWTTGTFRIVGRVYAKADTGDAGAAAAEAALATFLRQVEVTVINADAIRRSVQRFVSIETTTGIKTEGGLVFGEFEMNLALEYYQGPEDFAPPPASDWSELALYVDLVNLYSPTGDFTGDEPFAGTPAPRTSGPDGKPEGFALIPVD